MNSSDINSTPGISRPLETVSPKERLERSRRALLEQMRGGNPPAPDLPQLTNDAETLEGVSESSQTHGTHGTHGSGLSAVSAAAQTWWRHHPARAAIDMAQPIVNDYAARKPLMLLGIALAAGAAVVLFRPWRLISLGGMLIALVKSTNLRKVALSMLKSRLFPVARTGGSVASPVYRSE
jgi:hypothetical protein